MTLLIDAAVKVSLLALVALAATAILRRRSAALRHWVLATTLAGCLCLPALDLLLPAWTIPLPSAWFASPVESSIRLTSEPSGSPAGSRRLDSVPLPGETVRPWSVTSIVIVIWAGGAAIGVCSILAALWRLRRLVSRAQAVSPGQWHDVANSVSRQYGVRRPVRLLICPHPTMLATWGMLRPAILLPAGADAWPEDRVQVVLRHELAHVSRSDWIIALAASVLRAIHWFNPLVWFACRQIRHEAERACDDVVITSGIDAAEYATHLLDVARESAESRLWSPAIAIARRSTLEGRVRAMLDARLNRQPLTRTARATSLALLTAVSFSIGIARLSGDNASLVPQEIVLESSSTRSADPSESNVRAVNPRASHGASSLAGPVQVDVAGFCCPDYLAQLVSLVRRSWDNNQGVAGSTTVRFTIARDGTIQSPRLENPSGIIALDNSAMRAVRLTRLPPLPAEFQNPALTVDLRFEGAAAAARDAGIPAAQAAGGEIEGVLYDPFGGLLPGASVTLTSAASGAARRAFTDRAGAFVFRDLPAGDYELVTDLPGFTTVRNIIRAEPGTSVRRHITLPLGTLRETITVVCQREEAAPSTPTAPTSSTTPGPASRSSTAPSGAEPKIPSTFTGGIGGQISAPRKIRHANPACPSGVAPEHTVVQLAGRVGIDGIITDLHDVAINQQGGDRKPVAPNGFYPPTGSKADLPYFASAMAAARDWVFTPTLLNGAPIEANISVTVDYRWTD